MAFEFNQIADGHNNQAGLERWSKLTGTNGCLLFQGYKRFIPMEWNTSEETELGGDRLYVKIGTPWFAFVFPLISEEEDYKLTSTYTDDGVSGFVTVTAYDRDSLTWKDFNATIVIDPSNKNFNLETGFYTGYRVEFRDLEEL